MNIRIVNDDFVTCRMSKNISHGAIHCNCQGACRRDDLRAKYDDSDARPRDEVMASATQPTLPKFEVGKLYPTREGKKAKLVHIFPTASTMERFRTYLWVIDEKIASYRTYSNGMVFSDGTPHSEDIIPEKPFQFEIGKCYRTTEGWLVKLIYIRSPEWDIGKSKHMRGYRYITVRMPETVGHIDSWREDSFIEEEVPCPPSETKT